MVLLYQKDMPMKKINKKEIIILSIILIILGLISFFSFREYQAKLEREKKYIEASGMIEATEITISSEIGGKIIKEYISEGENVKKGQLLVELDDKVLKSQLKQAQAAVAAAETQLEIAMAGTRHEQIDQAKASLNQARAQKRGAYKSYQNALALYNQRTAQQMQVDAAQTQVDTLEAQKAGAEKGLENAKKLAQVSPQLDAAETALKSAQASYDKALAAKDGASAAVDAALANYNYLTLLYPSPRTQIQQEEINSAWYNYQNAISQLHQAEAGLISAQIALEGAQKNYDNVKLIEETNQQAQIDAAQTQVDLSKAQLTGAQKNLNSSKKLYDERTQAQQQVDVAETQYEIAKAQEAAAKAQLNLLINGPTTLDIKLIQAQVDQARASLLQVQASLDKTKFEAPRPGIIATKYYEVGETVTPGSPICKLIDLNKVTLTVYIPEIELGKVKIGQKVNVFIDSFPNKIFKGKVTKISSEAEFTPSNIQTKDLRASIVFAVTITIKNKNQILKPGMPADAQIILK